MKIIAAILYRLILLLFGILFALGVFELYLRFRSPPPSLEQTEDRPPTIFGPQPGCMHPWASSPANAFKIAVVGDSLTVGYGNHYWDTYGGRLEWLMNMNEGLRPVIVDIHAKAGASSLDEAKLAAEALADKPDLLILGVCLNDTENPLRRDDLTLWRDAMLVREPPSWLEFCLKRSAALKWLYLKKENARSTRTYYRYYKFLYRTDYSGWELWQKSIREIRDGCRKQKVRFVAVVFPLMDHLDAPQYPFEKYDNQICDFLKSEDILYLDLLPVFRWKSSLRMQIIPGVDEHPSEIAHRMAADAISQFLMDENLVTKAYAPREVSGSVMRKIWSHLMEKEQNAD